MMMTDPHSHPENPNFVGNCAQKFLTTSILACSARASFVANDGP